MEERKRGEYSREAHGTPDTAEQGHAPGYNMQRERVAETAQPPKGETAAGGKERRRGKEAILFLTCMARTQTPRSDSGYTTTEKPRSWSSRGLRMGVRPPPSSMFACGTPCHTHSGERTAWPRHTESNSSSKCITTMAHGKWGVTHSDKRGFATVIRGPAQ